MMPAFKHCCLLSFVVIFCLVAGCRNQPVTHTASRPSAMTSTVTADQLATKDGASLSDGMMSPVTIPDAIPTKKPKPRIQITQPDLRSSAPASVEAVMTPQAPQANRTEAGKQDVARKPGLRGRKLPVAKLPGEAKQFAKRVASAHGRFHWLASRCLKANITLEFNHKIILQGTLLTNRSAGQTRLDLVDGTTVVYDGHQVWVSPQDTPFKQARFHALTWASFLVTPFKLRDPGSRLITMAPQALRGKTYQAAKLTFSPGVGSTPSDWYMVYASATKPYWLRAMAYGVTSGLASLDAEQTLRVVTFDDFVKVKGVVLSRRWTFWNWNLEQGIVGKPIGRARLTGMQLVHPDRNVFAKPPNAILSATPR